MQEPRYRPCDEDGIPLSLSGRSLIRQDAGCTFVLRVAQARR